MEYDELYNKLFDRAMQMLAELKTIHSQAKSIAAQLWMENDGYEKWVNLAEYIENREWLEGAPEQSGNKNEGRA